MSDQDNNVRTGVQLLAAALALYGAKRVVAAGRRPMDPPSLAPSYPRPDVRLFGGTPAFGLLAPRRARGLAAITVPREKAEVWVEPFPGREVRVAIKPLSAHVVVLTARGREVQLQATGGGAWEQLSEGAWVADFPSFDAAVRAFARRVA